MAIRVMSCLVGQRGWIHRGPLGPVRLQILPDGDPESRLRDTRSHHLVRFRPPCARTLGLRRSAEPGPSSGKSHPLSGTKETWLAPNVLAPKSRPQRPGIGFVLHKEVRIHPTLTL